MSNTLLDSVLHNPGADNVPGTQLKAYYCPIDDLDTIPELSDSPADAAAAVTISGNFVPKAGKGFHELYVSPRTGHITYEKSGPHDSENYISRYDASLPGASDAKEAFLRFAKNNNLIVLVPELSGDLRMFGSKKYPARIETVTGDHGTAEGDEGKATVLQFTHFGSGVAPKFTGSAPLADSGSV